MHALNVSWVDLAVVGVVVISTILAVVRGFVRETLSIFSWAAAALATLYFGPAATALLRAHISTPLAAPLIAYIGIFLVVLIALSLVSHLLSEAVRRSRIGALDRSLGVPFGILRGLALVGFAYLAFSLLIPVRSQPPWLAHARFLPLIQGSSDALLALLPAQYRATATGSTTTSADRAPAAGRGVRVAHAIHDLQKRLTEATGNSGNEKP
ncbi:MAG TPA: CvpA family protein [Rhizomicrobium sp.]|jgi:membrane protein required for colicin V production|nr:CvpA family protein [Rhizomicrobium sp.]